MEIFCGTDIIEVERIKHSISSSSAFLKKIYTKKEIEEISNTKNKEIMYQRYAGRFAAKEAIYKAMSDKLNSVEVEFSFKDFEILNDSKKNGRPYVNVLNEKIIHMYPNMKIDISISHIKQTAIATAIFKI